jgi:hypothetical protein
METLHFTVNINAPKEKVWTCLWQDENYRKWTSAFFEGSHAVSDWKEGSKILFLSPSGEGMYSTIDKLVPNEFMAFKHHGIVKDGKEQPMDEETKKWSGAMETYDLKENNNQTEVTVRVDITEDHKDYFLNAFPKAMNILKELAES